MREIKDFGILFFGLVLEGVMWLAITRIMTSCLVPSEMGRFALIYTLAAFFFSLFIVPVATYVQRKILEWNSQGLVGLFSARYISYLFLTGIISGLLILFLKHSFTIGMDIKDLWIFFFMFGLTFITYLNSFYSSSLNIFKRRLFYVICVNSNLILGLIISLLLIYFGRKSAENWILGQLLGQLITLVFAGLIFYKVIHKEKAPLSGSRKALFTSEVFNFSWPIAVSSFIVWLNTQSYRFLVQWLTSIEVLGLFTVGFNLGNRIMEKFEALFFSFYDPIFYADISNNTPEGKALAWDKYAKAYFPAVILMAAYICSGGYFIAKIFVARTYQNVCGQVIIWAGLSFLFWTVVTIYKMVGIAKLHMKGLVLPYLFGAVVTFITIPLLVRFNPYLGTGLALALGALGTLAYLIIEMHKLLPIRFPLERVILAVKYALPLVAFFVTCLFIFKDAGLLSSLAILFLATLYLIYSQLKLSGGWFLKYRNPLTDFLKVRLGL